MNAKDAVDLPSVDESANNDDDGIIRGTNLDDDVTTTNDDVMENDVGTPVDDAITDGVDDDALDDKYNEMWDFQVEVNWWIV